MNSNTGRDDEIICRCEEITRREILDAIDQGCHTVDEVKRVTRAGMGPCQGRTCGKLVARLISESTGIPLNHVRKSSVRFPVRPVRIAVAAIQEIAEKTP